jgi:UDP-N-acetylmuramoylalanine--D-glutamate ligase
MAKRIGLELGSQRQEIFLSHHLVVVSPGVPWDLPQLQAARERGIPVFPEVEVAGWFLRDPIVGITGSNGKTTTTVLLGKMLEASGFPTFVGGNIGVALSTAVGRVSAGSVVVAELSSFQLEAVQDFRPHVAVLLNLSPNHLDRHPSLEAYAQAKRQIFRNQRAEDYAVLNADDPWVCSLGPALASRKVYFSRFLQIPNGVFVSNGHVVYRRGHLERVLFETREVGLRGAFNMEDVLAATAAACVLGADFEAIRRAVREFKGVEHRLEYVRTVDGVEFYNNSKATSVDATLKSLEAFERGVHLIMGGKDKGAPYAPLLPLLKDRVSDVLLIGAAADRIAQELAGAAELVRAGLLESAVREAFRRARPGDVVLLAPACSSFDQFQDYEERGRKFKEFVECLARDVESGAVSRQENAAPGAASRVAAEALEERASAAPEGPLAAGEDAGRHPVAALGALGPPESPLVYEVRAEELPSEELAASAPSAGPPDAAWAPPAPPESADDLPLPFEARAPKARPAPGRTETRDRASASRGAPPPSGPEPPQPAPTVGKQQPKLPGMD